jgi:glycine cleavage system H lipoate-binding protein
MNQLDIYENFRAIDQVADAEWIKRERKINMEILITEIALEKLTDWDSVKLPTNQII